MEIHIGDKYTWYIYGHVNLVNKLSQGVNLLQMSRPCDASENKPASEAVCIPFSDILNVPSFTQAYFQTKIFTTEKSFKITIEHKLHIHFYKYSLSHTLTQSIIQIYKFFPQFTTVDQRNHLKTTKHGKLYPKLKKITQALLLMLLTFCKSDPSQCNSTSRQNSPIQPSCHYLLTNEAILISSEMLNFLNSLFYDRKYHLKPFRLQAAVKL